MRKYKLLFGFLIASIFVITCGEKSDTVIGSRYHEIQKAYADIPEILANGVSTTMISAIVVDRNDELTDSMKVVFQTTIGTIEDFDYTDPWGEARAKLTSVASSVDLIAEVTATVVDTSKGALHKDASSPYKIKLRVNGFEEKSERNADLKKQNNSPSNIANTEVKFIGVTLSTTVEDTILAADGISKTKVTIKLLESTSKKGVEDAEVFFGTKMGAIDGKAYTDKQGMIQKVLTSPTDPGIDTLSIVYGNKISDYHTITYLIPKFELLPKRARILADGQSKVQLSAIVLNHKNNPIVGAEVKFSATAGIIPEKGTTGLYGEAKVDLRAGSEPDSAVLVIAEFLNLSDTSIVSFVFSSIVSALTFNADPEPILRNGVASKQITLHVVEAGQPLSNTIVNLQTDFGKLPEMVVTNQEGTATFDYTADAGETDVTATITASTGSIEQSHQIDLLGVNFSITATPDSIPANGNAMSVIRVDMKESTSYRSIVSHPISFATDMGSIQPSATTNNQGTAEVIFTAGRTHGIATITAICGELSRQISVHLFDVSYPSSILLEADPNFIWVKETGNLEQTIIAATVLGITGQPVGNDIGVRFTIINGPGGGEVLEPSSGTDLQTQIIRTVDGRAEANIRSGIRSGTVQIKAELVDFPDLVAQTTNIVIRSGPPYMWVDPSDPNHVIQHGSVLVEPGKHNVAFGNPVQDIAVTALFGDKYNNPVEQGTAVYFTTTGGIITTDAVTNAKSSAGVILQNAYPFPNMTTEDANQLNACCIPNPNNESVILDVPIPDFEGGVITNSLGTVAENDGVAVLLASTWGQDQNGNEIKVWTFSRVVYSVGVHTFTAQSNMDVLYVGEHANIYIRLYDHNGNPVAAGSSLTASTTAGKLSETSLMPSAEAYGYGTTYFATQLVNDLDPEDDESTDAIVTIDLDSPNGSGKIAVPIHLKNVKR